MPKISVYIPDELKARMDKHENINWSAIAQRAFEKEIRLNDMTLPDDDRLKRAISRLRESKEEYQAQNAVRGTAHGIEWAVDKASFEDLSMVTSIDPTDSRHNLAVAVCSATNDGGFWNENKPDHLNYNEYPDDEYVTCFIEGACSIWNEIKDKI